MVGDTGPEAGASGAACLICNPRSGSLAGLPDVVEQLSSAIAAAGFTLAVPPNADMELAAQWDVTRRAGVGTVFVAGGDGTIAALAALALEANVALALLPGGTMNRVCARLGLPADPVESVAWYAPGRETRLDIGTVNGEVFLFESLLGAPVRLLRYREMQRGQGLTGWAPLLRAAWRNLVNLRSPGVWLVLPGGRRLRGSAVIITLPEETGEPGFRIHVARHSNSLGRLRQAMAWFRGGMEDEASSDSVHAMVLAAGVPGAQTRFSLDGEMRLAPPPLRYRLRPGALRVLAPAPPA